MGSTTLGVGTKLETHATNNQKHGDGNNKTDKSNSNLVTHFRQHLNIVIPFDNRERILVPDNSHVNDNKRQPK